MFATISDPFVKHPAQIAIYDVPEDVIIILSIIHLAMLCRSYHVAVNKRKTGSKVLLTVTALLHQRTTRNKRKLSKDLLSDVRLIFDSCGLAPAHDSARAKPMLMSFVKHTHRFRFGCCLLNTKNPSNDTSHDNGRSPQTFHQKPCFQHEFSIPFMMRRILIIN